MRSSFLGAHATLKKSKIKSCTVLLIAKLVTDFRIITGIGTNVDQKHVLKVILGLKKLLLLQP